MIELALASVLIASDPKIYVDGMGWVNGSVVNHCLIGLGIAHVDELHDQSWEDFQDCVNYRGGLR
jgi:hypothetical protein